MSAKIDQLKTFIKHYGEIELLNGISTIFDQLGSDWIKAGVKDIGYSFSDSARLLTDISLKLDRIEHAYNLQLKQKSHLIKN